MLWSAFVLLIGGVCIGAWCWLAATLPRPHHRPVHNPIPSDREIKTGCTVALVLLVVAMAFAVAALLKGS